MIGALCVGALVGEHVVQRASATAARAWVQSVEHDVVRHPAAETHGAGTVADRLAGRRPHLHERNARQAYSTLSNFGSAAIAIASPEVGGRSMPPSKIDQLPQ